MIKNFVGGIAVGIANIIPGVSGGTMMVILGLFDRIMKAVSDVFKIENKNRMQDILFLTQVLVGAAVGLVGFAKVIDILFEAVPTQTISWFIGLILFSIPTLLKRELKGNKINWVWVVIGLAVIFVIAYLNPGKDSDYVVTTFPPNTMINLIKWVFIGMIAGATMLFPGVSGSMILLVLGQYYYFKGYVSAVTDFNFDTLLPLGFICIGIFLGILISAKLTDHFLSTNRGNTISLILGLIIASAIILIPLNSLTGLMMISTSIVAAIVGGVIVIYIEKFVD
jgi:putative membrane protein